MPSFQQPALFRRILWAPVKIFALVMVFVLPASAQSGTETLEELGYRLQTNTPDAAAELRFGDEVVWTLPHSQRLTVLAFSGPRDMTGNGWPDLMVLTGMSRSGRQIEVLELGPEPARSVYETRLMGPDAERLMQMPEGMFLGKLLGELGLYPLDPARLSPQPGGSYLLGYSDDGLSRLVIRRDGISVWASDNTVLDGLSDPLDMTGDGVDNLLVHEAVSRSQRRLHLLALGADGVEVLWQVSGHASDIVPLLEGLRARVEAGQSIADSPETDGEPLSPQEQLEALGFEIRPRDGGIELRLGDVVLWREGGRMFQHDLLPATAPGHLLLVTRYMISRQNSIETTLEIGPHGMRLLWQDNLYHGPSLPGLPQPPAPDDTEAPIAEIPAPLQPLPGYEIILTEARDRLVVRHEGREVWSLEAAVITYHRLWPGAPSVLAELRIQSHDKAGTVTNHILPLTNDGPGEASSRPQFALSGLPGDNPLDEEALREMLEGLRPSRPGSEIPEAILEQLQHMQPSR